MALIFQPSSFKVTSTDQIFLVLFAVLISSVNLQADGIGTVDIVFKFLGSSCKVVAEDFDNPEVDRVTCHLCRVSAGGVSGSLEITKDKAEASIACRQIGPIKLNPNI